jgi:hypothetical protein
MTRGYSIPSVRLDEQPIRGDSIIIKIDVENQELAVLEGARGWFESRRVKAVYLDGIAEQKKVIDFLTSFGFLFFDGRSLMPYSKEHFGVLAISPANSLLWN